MMIYSQDGAGLNEFMKFRSKNVYYEYTFNNSRHADFTDIPFIWPIVDVYGQLGDIPVKRMSELTNSTVLNFWDAYLKDKSPSILDGNDWPEVEIEVVN